MHDHGSAVNSAREFAQVGTKVFDFSQNESSTIEARTQSLSAYGYRGGDRTR